MRDMDASVRRYELINCPGCRSGRGWPKKSEKKFTRLTEDMTQDRSLWRSGIKVPNYR